MPRESDKPADIPGPVAIVGSNGFVGRHLTAYLHRRGWLPRVIVRTAPAAAFPADVDIVETDTTSVDGLATALGGCAAVINLAGMAHAGATDPELYEEPNIALPVRIAEAAAEAGVRRFLHLSSIHARLAEDDPAYRRPYGRSKLEAERLLAQFAREHPLPRIVSLRPPVIYGPGARGNVGLLDRLAKSGRPLPIGAIRAKRSYVSVWNMCSAIKAMLLAETEVWDRASGMAFEIADATPISVSDFYQALARSHGKRVVCFPVPSVVVRAGLLALGERNIAEGLLAPLAVSNQAFSEMFGWTPAWDHSDELTSCPQTMPAGD